MGSMTLSIISCAAFIPNMHINTRTSFARQIEFNAVSVADKEAERTILTENENGIDAEPTSNKSMETTNTVMKKKSNPSHTEGVFSPIVFLAKDIMGDDNLIKSRAKVISMHTDIISSFVNTCETACGNLVLKLLYSIADENKDGSIDDDELKIALHNLGFTWIEDKQLKGIMKRADADGNDVIDFQEFSNEIPRTLRTNLIKLAKKNGGEMGLLV